MSMTSSPAAGEQVNPENSHFTEQGPTDLAPLTITTAGASRQVPQTPSAEHVDVTGPGTSAATVMTAGSAPSPSATASTTSSYLPPPIVVEPSNARVVAVSGNLTIPSDGPVQTPNGEQAVQAYAKLEGKDICYFVRTLEVVIGRQASGNDAVDLHLGSAKSISRRHGRIYYDLPHQRFEMIILGKNGAFVNERFLPRNTTVVLEHG
jgi:hypothetical protein